jgi:hypothetical protein
MTAEKHGATFSRRDCVRVMLHACALKSKRARGMPGEGLTHGPPATKKLAAVTTGSAKIIRHSPRDGVTAYT